MKQLTIIGNLGQDATLKESNGRKFVSFSVAVNERYKNQDGQYVDNTDWINCTSNQTSLCQYLTKGKKLFCQGKIKINIFRSRDGQTKAGINLHCSHIELLGGQNNESKNEPPEDFFTD